MPNLDWFKNKKIAVFGLGKAGIASVDFLLNAGSKVFAWDDNDSSCEKLVSSLPSSPESPIPPSSPGGSSNNPEITLESQSDSGNDVIIADYKTYNWSEIDTLVLSPGVPLTHPTPHPIVDLAKAANCPIICDIELLYKAAPEAKFIGITGTNGKSTTSALIHHILKHAGLNVELGGNIGVSASSLPLLSKDGIYVIELSSYQLDLIHESRFNIAVFLNVTRDHIDRHGDMQGYIKAKKRIFNNQQEGDTAIIAVDDEHTKEIYNKAGNAIPVSAFKNIDNGISVLSEKGDRIIYDNTTYSSLPESSIPPSSPGGSRDNTEVTLESLHDSGNDVINLGNLDYLIGEHNNQNIVSAYAAARSLNIQAEVIIEAVKSFRGLAHRIQYVDEISGVIFINDSKATNADSTAQALKCFDNIYWIVGGKPKEGGISSLGEFWPKITQAYLIGESMEEFAEVLEGKVPYTKCDTIDNAVIKAYEIANEDNNSPVVLLSPACASFDQFKSFEERGEKFCEAVEEIHYHAAT